MSTSPKPITADQSLCSRLGERTVNREVFSEDPAIAMRAGLRLVISQDPELGQKWDQLINRNQMPPVSFAEPSLDS